MEITGGGRVTDLAANVGSANGGDGAVVVSGFGSEWSHSGNLSIGVAGSGLMTIERGAIVRNASGFIASPTGDAAVRVDGTGSTWINAQSLAIGDGGELIVTDGGVVQVGQNISIGTGALADVQGTLRATGSAANAGEIRLGGGASRIEATQLANQGLVTGGGLIAATLQNAAGGQVDVAAGERLTLSGMDNVNRGEVNLAGGEIAFDDSLLNDQTGFVAGRGTIRAAGGITNQATMTFSGGQTDLHADVVNTGASALILTTGGGTTTFFGAASNGSGGEIRVSRGSNVVFLSTFNGGPTGEGTAVIEGVLAPCNSPAAVNFAGQLIVAAQATVEMELGGTMPGTEHDAITVGNTLELDGTLNLLPIGGYSDPPRGQADRFA
jgi:T5SS/PEP-CTERM-associated repeat protein